MTSPDRKSHIATMSNVLLTHSQIFFARKVFLLVMHVPHNNDHFFICSTVEVIIIILSVTMQTSLAVDDTEKIRADAKLQTLTLQVYICM